MARWCCSPLATTVLIVSRAHVDYESEGEQPKYKRQVDVKIPCAMLCSDHLGESRPLMDQRGSSMEWDYTASFTGIGRDQEVSWSQGPAQIPEIVSLLNDVKAFAAGLFKRYDLLW